MTQNIKKVLFVEDEEVVAKLFELKLRKAGFAVKLAMNGEEALAILKKEHFDILITDIIMPRMDGFTLIKKVRDQKNTIPIIVTTNLSEEEDKKIVMNLGANDYISKKDVSSQKLIELINHHLGAT